MALTYTTRLDASGQPLVSSVLASDGTVVLTGQDMVGGALVTVAVQGDASATQAYQAWLKAGGVLGPAAPSVASLSAYARSVWTAFLAKGQTFAIGTSGQPTVAVLCDGTNDTRADLALLALFGQVNPTATKTWLDNAGKTTVLTGSQCVTMATLAGTWVSDTYPALATLLGEIASGSVTSTAAIDAYAWPTA